MSTTLKITDSELLSLARDKGYEIIIEDAGNTYEVLFEGHYSDTKSKVLHTYSKEWDCGQIRLDVLPKLLKWADLHLVAALEYK